MSWILDLKKRKSSFQVVVSENDQIHNHFFKSLVTELVSENTALFSLLNCGIKPIILTSDLDGAKKLLGEDLFLSCKFFSSPKEIKKNPHELVLMYNYNYKEYNRGITVDYISFINSFYRSTVNQGSKINLVCLEKARKVSPYAASDSLKERLPSALLYFSSLIIGLRDSEVEVLKDRFNSNVPSWDNEKKQFVF